MYHTVYESRKSDAYPLHLTRCPTKKVGVFGLRLVRLVIPTYKFRGESALLECLYELESVRNSDEGYNYGGQFETDEKETLYSVKWYKDNEEFYRYIPSQVPPQHSFRVEGVRVDHKFSDSTRVMLRGITLKSTGEYRCEVSGEAPAFKSIQGEGRLDVIYLPKDGPHIKGEEDRQYQVGDILKLNCTSGKSHPFSLLEWYINDEQVRDRNSLVNYPPYHHPHGLITTRLGLNLILEPRHFTDGAVRVKCVASLSPVLWRGGKESIVPATRRQHLLDNREAMLLVKCFENVGMLTLEKQFQFIEIIELIGNSRE
ncbi:Immunoglobulin-like domain [Sergentomyia squamirostris]